MVNFMVLSNRKRLPDLKSRSKYSAMSVRVSAKRCWLELKT